MLFVVRITTTTMSYRPGSLELWEREVFFLTIKILRDFCGFLTFFVFLSCKCMRPYGSRTGFRWRTRAVVLKRLDNHRYRPFYSWRRDEIEYAYENFNVTRTIFNEIACAPDVPQNVRRSCILSRTKKPFWTRVFCRGTPFGRQCARLVSVERYEISYAVVRWVSLKRGVYACKRI